MNDVKPIRYPPLWFQVTFFAVAASLSAVISVDLAVHNPLFWERWWVWVIPVCIVVGIPLLLREIAIAWRSRDLRCRIEELTHDRESNVLKATVLIVLCSGNAWRTDGVEIRATMIDNDTMAAPRRVLNARAEIDLRSGVIAVDAVLPSGWEHGAAFLKVTGRREGSRRTIRCQFPLIRW